MTPHPIQDAVLRVDRLSVVYPGGVTALRDTSIAFRRGEFTVLLGLSGAGKSTVLNALEDMGWEVLDNLPVRLIDRLLASLDEK